MSFLFNKNTERPGFKILSNGLESSASGKVISIKVSHTINKVPEAEIVIHDGDASKQDFELSGKDEFTPGKELEIKAGYADEHKTIFKGVIVKHAITTGGDRISNLTVRLKHKVFVTTLGRKSAVFEQKNDGQIIEDILSKAGINKDVAITTATHTHMTQFNCTDWDFINLRAEANGLLINVTDKTVEVKKPSAVGLPKLKLTYGTNILEFDAELDARVCFEDYKSKTWSYADQQIKEVSSDAIPPTELGSTSSSSLSSDLGLGDLEINNGGTLLDADAKGVANIFKIKGALSKIKGRAKCIGTSDVSPGDVIQLAGLGDKFNGTAFVNGVMQEISGGNWFTHIEFGLDSQPYAEKYSNIQESAGGNVIAGINGLQVGIVSKIKDDPDDEARVLVKIPIATGTDDAVWARVARLDAGNERGMIFHPEENDEVILGFINDDPRQAVILGMLNSSKLPLPDDLKAADKNPIKGIITREKLQLLFDDDKKIITILAEKGTIVIDDDKKSITIMDKNENEFVMDDKGVTLTSKKDFIVKADGDVKMEGKNIELKASAKFTAEGSSGTTVKSSAITEVKGSMVNIN